MERVYVTNLPPNIRIKDIDDIFRPFGNLVYIDVNHRANPVCAYVQFDSARNAFDAVKGRYGFDYGGYKLRLRLVENEVRNRRDNTPPPFVNNSYDRHMSNGEFNNNYNGNCMAPYNPRNFSSSQSSSNNCFGMEQNKIFPSSNRSNMQDLNMMPYSSTNHSNIGQQFPDMSSNMQQSFAPTDRFNMPQQYSNFNRTNIQPNYSDINRSNVPYFNNFENHPNRTEVPMQQYPSGYINVPQQSLNVSRPNIPKLQNMNIQRPDDSSWDTRNANMGWNNGSFGNDNFGNNFNNSYNNGPASTGCNPNTDHYSNQVVDDNFNKTRLSGSGRKWLTRYVDKGFSAETARAKALEHKKVPYARGDTSNKKPTQNDSTNVALETIGNTIISLLADNAQAGFPNNIGIGRIERPGPASQEPLNAASKRQYLKSLSILKSIREKRIRTSKDVTSLRYHSKIVKDYEIFHKIGSRNESKTSKTQPRTEKEVSELLIKQKAKLLKKAREIGNEAQGKKRFGGAFKKRTKILLDHGFLELEAKALAWNPLSTLEELLSLKKEYDLLAKKTVFIPASKASLANMPKDVVYRNDLQYLEEYAKHRINGLSKTILYGLRACIKRIHAYEKSENMPLTENKFTTLLLKITSRESLLKNVAKVFSQKKKNQATTNSKTNAKTTQS